MDKEGIQEFVKILRVQFEKDLQSKTGWGKNEVINLLDKSVSLSIMELWKQQS